MTVFVWMSGVFMRNGWLRKRDDTLCHLPPGFQKHKAPFEEIISPKGNIDLFKEYNLVRGERLTLVSKILCMSYIDASVHV
jgi:hypothetical protein